MFIGENPIHIAANADIAEIVLMPGDPLRAKYIAENFLKDAKLVTSIRNMFGYTGYYKDRLVTVFPSGMGNPSMGIYSYELFKEYGVENIIRIGSCGGYAETLKLNDVILATGSYSDSDYARELDGTMDKQISSSNNLNLVVESTAKSNNINLVKGNIFCSDAFYEKAYDYRERVKNLGVLGIEMETFALFNNARKFGKKATALLTVSDLFFSEEKLSSLDREKNLNDMIVLALESCLKL